MSVHKKVSHHYTEIESETHEVMRRIEFEEQDHHWLEKGGVTANTFVFLSIIAWLARKPAHYHSDEGGLQRSELIQCGGSWGLTIESVKPSVTSAKI